MINKGNNSDDISKKVPRTEDKTECIMGIETPYIWVNGDFVNWEEAKEHHINHSLHYGGGVFEGIRFYETSNGPKVFKLDEHIKRLFYSANYMSIKISFSEKDIIKAVLETVKKSGEISGYIRPIVYKGYGKMGLNPDGANTNLVISVWKWGKYLSDKPINVKISKIRRIHKLTTDMEAKICGNYANSIISSHEIKKEGYQEGLLLDTDGYIAEGPGENIFFVKGKEVFTPEKGTILPGITRQTIITLLKNEFSIDVIENKIKPEELSTFDEAFFVGTATEVTAIGNITDENGNNNDFKSGNSESLTQNIKKYYLDMVSGKNEKYKKWLS